MPTIVVTPRSLSLGDHPLLARLREAGYQLAFPSPGRQPTRAQLQASMADAVGYLAGVERIDAALLAAAPSLRVISRNGTGVDAIDLEKAEELGITICRAEGANAEGVAELAFGLILGAARGLQAAESALKEGHWQRSKGRELEGKTLGLAGCGRIGRRVAGFALAFGMEVLAHDAFPDPRFAPPGRFAFAPLDLVLRRADYLSLHCPALPGGRPLLDAAAFAAVKPGLVLVNTARESLVDQPALFAALDAGRVAEYAIDAFDHEPPEDWSLIRHPRVQATPHIGGFTDESIDRATAVAVDNLLANLARPGR